ncbi:hypothetical protein CYMTET_48493 [Cymbomonas tetramitiformis]|uniref:Uncharacterized protein n=1 Tax=Cymbomonas tetramitiformis TaxID=36881 RepID=A0AAE0BT77_9CHLO|nr:hypothetical protein CYMTET_48493 [Cymbomonas tetramitiformis]
MCKRAPMLGKGETISEIWRAAASAKTGIADVLNEDATTSSGMVETYDVTITGVTVRTMHDDASEMAPNSTLSLVVECLVNVRVSDYVTGSTRRSLLQDRRLRAASQLDDIAATITASVGSGALSASLSTAAARLNTTVPPVAGLNNEVSSTMTTPEVDDEAALRVSIGAEIKKLQRVGDQMSIIDVPATADLVSTSGGGMESSTEQHLAHWDEQLKEDVSAVETLGTTMDELRERQNLLTTAFELVQDGLADTQAALQKSLRAQEALLAGGIVTGPFDKTYTGGVPECALGLSLDGRTDHEYAFRVFPKEEDSSARRQLLAKSKGDDASTTTDAVTEGASKTLDYTAADSWKLPKDDVSENLALSSGVDFGRYLVGIKKNRLVGGGPP